MLSERKKALSGVEKLHNYTKIGDFKSLNGEGKQVLSVDVSRANNDRFVTGGQNNSVSFLDFSKDFLYNPPNGSMGGFESWKSRTERMLVRNHPIRGYWFFGLHPESKKA